MKEIIDSRLAEGQAALWFLGQAGYIIQSCGKILVIDPYLSDSVGRVVGAFSRAIPIPLAPSKLQADIYIVTHDHLDHLDPETIAPYRYKDRTVFVGPRLAVKKLQELGIAQKNIVKIDAGEGQEVLGVKITGVYAIPNGPEVIDTCGYKMAFGNGRSVYHSSDTDFGQLLLACVPRAEVALLCINGKDGNLSAAEAAQVAGKIKPQTAIPNHYDMMALNSENPAVFEYCLKQGHPEIAVRILSVMEKFVWEGKTENA